MRSFIHSILRFALLPLAWFTAMAWINLRNEEHDDLPIHARTLFMGDSHIGCALDTAVMPWAQNIALPAEPYLITYYKLRRIAAQHRIDTIVVGFGPHNLGDYDLRNLHTQGWATERSMQRLVPLISLREAWQLPIDRKYFLQAWFDTYCWKPRSNHGDYIGYFIRLHRNYKDDSEFTAHRHFREPDGSPATLSPLAKTYLDSIIGFTNRHNIKLYLVGTPNHPDYMQRVPRNFMNGYSVASTRIRQSGISVMDHLSLYDQDSLFAMSDHMGARGAKAFTALLRDEMDRTADTLSAH